MRRRHAQVVAFLQRSVATKIRQAFPFLFRHVVAVRLVGATYRCVPIVTTDSMLATLAAASRISL